MEKTSWSCLEYKISIPLQKGTEALDMDHNERVIRERKLLHAFCLLKKQLKLLSKLNVYWKHICKTLEDKTWIHDFWSYLKKKKQPTTPKTKLHCFQYSSINISTYLVLCFHGFQHLFGCSQYFCGENRIGIILNFNDWEFNMEKN